MFTGIIQSIGQITQITAMGEDVKLHIETKSLAMQDVNVGDSIAVNGVCLTAIHLSESHFEAHISKETLSVTVGLNGNAVRQDASEILNDFALEDEKLNGFSQTYFSVNLEKALRLSDRLGGHLVSGHVDGIGEVVNFIALGDCWKLDIRAPHAISKYIAIKGSVCINGVSLTVNSVAKDVFSMNLIPHTLENTTLQYLQTGSLVNVEVDQIARYIDRMAEWSAE